MKMKKRKLMIVVLVAILSFLMYCVYCIYKKETTLNEAAINKNVPQAASISNWDLDKVDIVYDTNNVPVPVPKGFTASQVDGEHTVNTGFVIYSGTEPVTGENSSDYGTDAWRATTERNQWVWCPMTMNTKYNGLISNLNGYESTYTYDFSAGGLNPLLEFEPISVVKGYGDVNKDDSILTDTINETLKYGQSDFYVRTQNDYLGTKQCIEKYGGIYVARYELKFNPQSDRTAVSRKMQTPSELNLKQWLDACRNMENIGGTSTCLMWSTLYDSFWLNLQGKEIQYGFYDYRNYSNVADSPERNYMDVDGTLKTIPQGTAKILNSGSCEQHKVYNIYDIGGNLVEMTSEIDLGYRLIGRGGCYRDGNGATINSTHYRTYGKKRGYYSRS